MSYVADNGKWSWGCVRVPPFDKSTGLAGNPSTRVCMSLHCNTRYHEHVGATASLLVFLRSLFVLLSYPNFKHWSRSSSRLVVVVVE